MSFFSCKCSTRKVWQMRRGLLRTTISSGCNYFPLSRFNSFDCFPYRQRLKASPCLVWSYFCSHLSSEQSLLCSPHRKGYFSVYFVCHNASGMPNYIPFALRTSACSLVTFRKHAVFYYCLTVICLRVMKLWLIWLNPLDSLRNKDLDYSLWWNCQKPSACHYDRTVLLNCVLFWNMTAN